MKRNYVIFHMQQVMASCASLLITGSIIQTFLLESGCSDGQVSSYISVMQVVQVLAMLLLSSKMERIRNIFHSIAGAYAMQIPLFVTMLILSIKYETAVERKYMIMFCVSLVVSVFQGLYAVMGYKLPYYIIDMKEYGRITGISGVLLGVTGVAFAGLLSWCVGSYPYFKVMALFSGLGIIFTTATVLLTEGFRPISDAMQEKARERINLFQYKPFYQLFAPNLFRGISTGVFNMIVLIGYFTRILDSEGATMLVTISQVATIVGCFLYSVLSGRVRDGKLTFVSSILLCMVLPLMLLGKSQFVFLFVYFVAYLFVNFVNYAIPVLVARNIDYRCIGQYSAWRMALHTLGMAIGSALVPVLLNIIGSVGCMLFCGVMMIGCGGFYYKFEKQWYCGKF